MTRMKRSKKSAPEKPVKAVTRQDSVLAAAAELFAERGYAGTSIRDIGERVGLLGGSLYHYIRSKEALFVRIHDDALQGAEDRIRQAIAGITDSEARLAMACRVLLAIQLDPNSLTMPLMNDFRAVPDAVREQLIERRDTFEKLFRELVDAVTLPTGIDPDIYRIMLLTTINNAATWYKPGRLSLDEVAQQIQRVYFMKP